MVTPKTAAPVAIASSIPASLKVLLRRKRPGTDMLPLQEWRAPGLTSRGRAANSSRLADSTITCRGIERTYSHEDHQNKGQTKIRFDFVLCLFSYAFMGCCGDDNLPFRVELWDDKDRHIEELIALVSDYSCALGAYE